MKPFLKWAGAKTKVVPRIAPFVPRDAKRLVEPFVGSAAVALNLNLPKNVLADANADLVLVYDMLRKHEARFIDAAEKLFTPANNSEKAFYRFRDEFNTTKTKLRKACLFIYLNRHCFNGLCRYNASGEFNVPFGTYASPGFPRKEMEAAVAVLKRSTLRHADYRDVIKSAKPGDFVYCDPPYVPLSATANFTSYSKGGFGPDEQKALVEAAVKASAKGAVVVISNHDTPETRALYQGASVKQYFKVARRISCDGENRTDAAEVLAVYNLTNVPLGRPTEACPNPQQLDLFAGGPGD